MDNRIEDVVIDCEDVLTKKTNHLSEAEKREVYTALAFSLQEQVRHMVVAADHQSEHAHER